MSITETIECPLVLPIVLITMHLLLSETGHQLSVTGHDQGIIIKSLLVWCSCLTVLLLHVGSSCVRCT